MTSATARPRVVAGLRLVRLVGHGGEGEVWEARTSRGEARALKLIRPDALVEPEEVERRGRWLRAVDHPALVRVHRTGLLGGGGLDGWAFVDMAYLDGPSLDAAPADPGALVRLDPLAGALDALHAGAWSDGVPLVHRDVKPANLIDVDGRLVLVDHSTLRDASAETVTRIGTPVFAAPEVPLGRAGPPADVYAFAATAVALLTGERGRALAALLDTPGEADLPEGLRAALAPDPRDRPTSCLAALHPPPAVHIPRADAPEAAWANVEVPSGATTWYPPHQAVGDAAEDVPAAPGLPPPAAPAAVWRWVAVLVGVVVAPTAALAVGVPPWPELAAVCAAAAGLHLAAHALAGGPSIMRVLAPPLAWAWLLADRAAAQPRRRAYARAVLTGALLAGTAAAAWGVIVDGDETLPLLAAVCALLLAVGGIVAARRGGPLLQLLLLPAWAAGAVVLIAGAVVLSVPALLIGRGGAALRLAWSTVVSTLETLRRPVAPPNGLF